MLCLSQNLEAIPHIGLTSKLHSMATAPLTISLEKWKKKTQKKIENWAKFWKSMYRSYDLMLARFAGKCSFWGAEAPLVLLKACGWSRGASGVVKVRRRRLAPFESCGSALRGHENRQKWWNFTKIQSTPKSFKRRWAPPAHFRNLRSVST